MSLRSRLSSTASLLWRRLRGSGSPSRAGLSVGIGLFIGCLPLYGLHLPLCLALCLPLRLDAVLAYLAANISNPLLAPFLLFAEVEIGSYLLTGEPVTFDVDAARRIGVGGFLAQAALGSIVLGGALALLGGVVTARLSARLRRRAPASALELAVARTLRRYRGAPRGDRYYVASKLRLDPVLAHVSALGPLGSVLDAGCGRGQLALCLLELASARRVEGFDFDARKVDVAREAAGDDARFEVGDLRAHPLAAADTILLIDVLHYLSPAEQDAVLARAAAAVAPGGRVLVREVDARRGLRGWLTRALERIGVGAGYNRASAGLGFRSLREIVTELERCGLSCRVEEASEGLPLANALVIAEKTASRAPSNREGPAREVAGPSLV